MIDKISVIICTLNRAESLGRTLLSIDPPRSGAVTAEIVVVDNGSDHQTVQAVKRFARTSRMPVHWAREACPGLSMARNRGIASASGDLLVFIDDDARAEPGWLDALSQAVMSCPGAMAAGGPVRPAGKVALPDWLPRRLYSHLSILDYGELPKPLTYPYYPFGTNMAVKRTAVERVGGFDPDLGRKGVDSFMTGEETDLFLRIEKAGGIICYQPAAAVRHTLDPRRLDPQWILAQTHRIGYSAARMEKKSMPRPYCLGHGLTALARIPVAAAAWGVARLSRNPKMAVFSRSIVYNAIGYLRGVLS